MIYYETGDLDIIAEVVYLGEEFCDTFPGSKIFVNPPNPSYIVRKVVILNTPGYPLEKIKVLYENQCSVISRVIIQGADHYLSDLAPYIRRPYFDISWNGRVIGTSEWKALRERGEQQWTLDLPDYKLYFPKIIKDNDTPNYEIPLTDEGGKNLTWLGWLLWQVGIEEGNGDGDSVFHDLDLIKTKKMDFREGYFSYM